MEETQATLVIPIKDSEHLDKVFAAEEALRQAGISFDMGFDTDQKERHWELDRSLSGAQLERVREVAKDLGVRHPIADIVHNERIVDMGQLKIPQDTTYQRVMAGIFNFNV